MTGREHEDPVIANFLTFLENDMVRRPDTLVPLTQELLSRGQGLIEGVEIDLDAPLLDE